MIINILLGVLGILLLWIGLAKGCELLVVLWAINTLKHMD